MMLARLLSKIYKKNGIILIDSQGQKYICGKPDSENPLTMKILKKDLNWKLALNPDLNFPEAYMRGEILIENGSLLDFLNPVCRKYIFVLVNLLKQFRPFYKFWIIILLTS